MMDAARRFYQQRYGDDGWFEAVENAYYEAIAARHEADRIRRQTPPDYARITPHDQLERIKTEFGV